jgi:hypothetical protein
MDEEVKQSPFEDMLKEVPLAEFYSINDVAELMQVAYVTAYKFIMKYHVPWRWATREEEVILRDPPTEGPPLPHIKRLPAKKPGACIILVHREGLRLAIAMERPKRGQRGQDKQPRAKRGSKLQIITESR